MASLYVAMDAAGICFREASWLSAYCREGGNRAGFGQLECVAKSRCCADAEFGVALLRLFSVSYFALCSHT